MLSFWRCHSCHLFLHYYFFCSLMLALHKSICILCSHSSTVILAISSCILNLWSLSCLHCKSIRILHCHLLSFWHCHSCHLFLHSQSLKSLMLALQEYLYIVLSFLHYHLVLAGGLVEEIAVCRDSAQGQRADAGEPHLHESGTAIWKTYLVWVWAWAWVWYAMVPGRQSINQSCLLSAAEHTVWAAEPHPATKIYFVGITYLVYIQEKHLWPDLPPMCDSGRCSHTSDICDMYQKV